MLTSDHIQRFLDGLRCSDSSKQHSYYRALRAFFNWLYSRKSSYGLDARDIPTLGVDAPFVEKKILPNLTSEQLEYVIEHADCVRDKAIISLFADSGLRPRELAGVDPANIDWQRRLLKAHCKGNKDALAPFGQRTEALLRQRLSAYTSVNGRLWNINANGIEMMLNGLRGRPA